VKFCQKRRKSLLHIIIFFSQILSPQKRNFLFSSVNYTNFANYLKISPNSRYQKIEKERKPSAPDKQLPMWSKGGSFREVD